MANLEKLVKALEALKLFQSPIPLDDAAKKKDQPISKKDKVLNCNVIADCICSVNLRNVAEFPKFLGIAMETFLLLCDDKESDVRMAADECLNRTIKTLLETNLGRLQVELYKEIKKNGTSRSLRAALWRFADMCHLIRPQKCRPYVVNLLPCMARICKRPEEAVQETLSTAMTKICPVLMGFTTDTDIKMLLKSFLPNIESNNATCRRTAAASLGLICQYSRKPVFFFTWLLNQLMDLVIPVSEDIRVYTLLGVFLTLRHMIPHLTNQNHQELSLKGSFGVMTQEQEVKVNAQQIIQIYELLLHYSGHADHNVVTASLETFSTMLRNMPPLLLRILTTRGSIKHTSIFEDDVSGPKRTRIGSQSSALPSVAADDVGLIDDFDASAEANQDTSVSEAEPLTDDIDQDDPDSVADNIPDIILNENGEGAEDEVFPEDTAPYTNVEIGDVNEEQAVSHSSSTDTLSDAQTSPSKGNLIKGVSEDTLNRNPDESLEIDVSEAIQPAATTSHATLRDGDIGSIIDDDDIPLLHCIRLLCSRFLLTGYPQGLIPDKQVRVSVKALALSCIGSAMNYAPHVFFMSLHKSSQQEGDLQAVSDLLLYTSHCDPQLKGNTSVMLSNIIKAVLAEARGKFAAWIKKHGNGTELDLERLVQHLLTILEDESSVATRLGLIALKTCLNSILNSHQCDVGLKVVLSLIHLKKNPYWLVKVELLELLSELDLKLLAYLEAMCPELGRGKHHYAAHLQLQTHILDHVVIELLGDEDARVRHAAAHTVVKLIPSLFYAVDNLQQDPVIAKARETTATYFEPILQQWTSQLQPPVHGLVPPFHLETQTSTSSVVIESSLSRVVAMLMISLHKSDSRHLKAGCCQALCLLAARFPVTQFAAAWGCALQSVRSQRSRSISSIGRTPSASTAPPSINRSVSMDPAAGCGGGPLPIVLALVTSSALTFDLVAHQDALQLAGNLFAGATFQCLRAGEETMSISPTSEEAHWAAVTDRSLIPIASQLLAHLARLLNICAHILDEQTPGPPQTKPSLPSLPNAPSLSPIKRKAKGIKEEAEKTPSSPPAQDGKPAAKATPKDKDKEAEKSSNKKDGLGAFYNLPHYMKLYEVLKGAYSNYKISLDLSSQEKFGSLLRTVLHVFSQVLEIAGLVETGRHAEEMLGYLKATIAMEATASILCVQQLLKSLFGTNLASYWEPAQTATSSGKPGKAARMTSSVKPGLYHSCFTTPYTQFTQSLASASHKVTVAAPTDQEDPNSLMAVLKKRAERKVPAVLKPGSKADKTSIASYIRLFEPLVIKALKQYTITSSLCLQQQVLNLLAQLVQLRVNYCLLDSDQIFIGFVIKQFEFIEEGQIRHSETLIPNIFQFLVLLSYEQYHSKTIIGMPKIIQLCDGIMASGQQPTTHAIPALQPIVYDLFVLRSSTKADAFKDLETQREVVVSMLLRLIQYYQVLEMLIVVLHQSRKESEEKWKRLSRQVIDMVLPLLMKQQVNLEGREGLDVVHRLFESVAPSVFRPVDTLLKALFAPPHSLESLMGVQRWLCLILVIIRVLMAQSKEEVVLSRLQELGLAPHLFTDTLARHQGLVDPAVEESHFEPPYKQPPEELFSRFLLQVIGLVTYELSRRVGSLNCQGDDLLFLCQGLGHLLLCTTHMFQSGLYRRVATMTMKLANQEPPAHFYSVSAISEAFRGLSTHFPTLTLQWCHVLVILNMDGQDWWTEVMRTPHKYRRASPSRPSIEFEAPTEPPVTPCNMEIVRRGGTVLFCDYVCENLSDAEHMTWVIINHVGDLIELYNEPPVQDFISAIHRNSAASGLFIQAIHSRCENMHKASLVKKTLHCLEAIHLSQSGALLTLLIDKFLHTTHLAVARFCDMIACRRVEMLLAESVEESSSQLPLEDLEKLLQFMKTSSLTKRHARLASLLNKLRNLICPESRLTLAPEKTHPLALTTTKVSDIKINKEWFQSIVRDQCFSPSPLPRECARLLAQLDYTSILNITMATDFHLSILPECITFGTQSTLHNVDRLEDQSISVINDNIGSSPAKDHALEPLLRAAEVTLFRHINHYINMMPVPHEVINYTDSVAQSEESYRDKMEYLFADMQWVERVFHLGAALTEYLVSISVLPWKPAVPEESQRDVCRFSILLVEVLHWMLVHDHFASSDQHQVVLECFSLVLQNPNLFAVIGQKEHTSWACSAIRLFHQLLNSMLVLPGDRLVTLPNQDSQEDFPNTSFDGMRHTGICMPCVSYLGPVSIQCTLDISQYFFSKKLRKMPHSSSGKSSLLNPLKPGAKSRKKMQLEQRQQALLQLHLSDQQFNCLLKCALYQRFDDFHHVVKACDQISELVHCMKTHLNPTKPQDKIPQFLAGTLRNIVIGLARLPLVNSYARTPPLVWKLGWLPSPSGEMKTQLPPLPQDYMQEKDVLKEFIFRVNLIGWTSRQQFEETWMGLLGLLNPAAAGEEEQISPEEDVERSQTAVLAIRCITSLLVQSLLTPHSGDPTNSSLVHHPRDKPLDFLKTRCGRKLLLVRQIVEQEVQALTRQRTPQDTHHHQSCPRTCDPCSLQASSTNLERELGSRHYHLGQISVESIWGLVSMLEPTPMVQDSSSDSATDTSPDSPAPPFPQQPTAPKIEPRSAETGGLDIHSCLQFLLELYGQFLSPSATVRVPLLQLNETVKSIVMLSDVFTEKPQFEWMLEQLLEVQKWHPVEDELIMQYLVVGICKAAAVTGMDAATVERIIKVVDTCLRSPHLPTRITALYGSLYILETGMSELTQQVVPLVADYVVKHLGTVSTTTVNSQEHLMVMWSTSFYLIENYHAQLRETDLMSRVVQMAVSSASGSEDVTPLPIYLQILRGLERLLLSNVLTKQDSETLVKLSVDRLCLPSPQRSLASLGLMLTCMYSGKQLDQYTPTQDMDAPAFPFDSQITQDPESLIVAMERVTVLFDRIRKGFPYEARVITRVLPTFLADFFPPQDIMNKVIGEFLSAQQPHPQLMAKVVFQVFEHLLQKNQHSLVRDWVMLSLSNFTQRTPVAMAIWSLTCFFLSASTNPWLRGLLPHVLERMGRLDTVDRRLFCITALDFRHQLTDQSQRRAFQTTFQAVAQPDTPYTELLSYCS